MDIRNPGKRVPCFVIFTFVFACHVFLHAGAPYTFASAGARAPKKISAGAFHTCVVFLDRTAKCWGEEGFYQLGNTKKTSAQMASSVKDVDFAVDIAAGESHTCAQLLNGNIQCWGNNRYGQLGNLSAENAERPVLVSGINTAVQISAGAFHTCSVLSSGSVKCWGNNFYGQLGNGSKYGPKLCSESKTSCSTAPDWVSGLMDVKSVTAGAFHTCALMNDATVKCWGDNASGQLGNGFGGRGQYSVVPVSVSGLKNVKSVSAGIAFTCAVLIDGSVKCWGDNTSAQLGSGNLFGPSWCAGFSCSPSPVAVKNIMNAVNVAAGGRFACAVLSDGAMKCWGQNDYGQLGTDLHGDTMYSCGGFRCSPSPVDVTGISNAVYIAAGDSHACAVLSTDEIKCWGYNGGGELALPSYQDVQECDGTYGKSSCSRIPLPVSYDLYSF